MEKVFVGGIKMFERREKELERAKYDYEIIETKSHKQIIVHNLKEIWEFSTGRNEYSRYLNLFSTVVRQAKSWCKNNPDKIPEYYDSPIVNYINWDIIKHVGKTMIHTDLNKCYAEVIYKLGYISEKTYLRLMQIPPQSKRMRQVAIGSLGTIKRRRIYKNGVKVSAKPKKDKQLKCLHQSILKYVDDMMIDLHNELEGRLFMWLTDCAIYLPKDKKKVEDFFMERGFGFDHEMVKITEYDKEKKKIYWIKLDDPDTPKSQNLRPKTWKL